MGLFGGMHCVAMCGSASSVLCARKGAYTLSFNLGRAAGYVLLGAAAGAVGSWTVGHGIDGLRFAFRALAATTMLLVGLHLAGLPSFIGLFERAGAPLAPCRAYHAAAAPLRTAWHATAAGMLWSLMPCGLLYAALATSASAYSALDGAATMAAFAAGTLPVMLGVGALSSRLAPLLRKGKLRAFAGMVVLAFGVWSTAGVAAQAGLFPSATGSSPRRALIPEPASAEVDPDVVVPEIDDALVVERVVDPHDERRGVVGRERLQRDVVVDAHPVDVDVDDRGRGRKIERLDHRMPRSDGRSGRHELGVEIVGVAGADGPDELQLVVLEIEGDGLVVLGVFGVSRSSRLARFMCRVVSLVRNAKRAMSVVAAPGTNQRWRTA